MDLGEIIDATEEITFEFLGEKNTAVVYTAGISRLTVTQAKAFREKDDPETAQLALPIIVKSWDVKWHGEPLAIESVLERDAEGAFVYSIPVAFAGALMEEAEKVFYGRPTKASESPAGLQPEENTPLTEAIQ